MTPTHSRVADGAVSLSPSRQNLVRPRALIAGGGVAGLETLLALRASAADRIDITILAPELKFVNRSMAGDQPLKPQRVRGLKLEETCRARRPLAHPRSSQRPLVGAPPRPARRALPRSILSKME